MDWSYFDKFDEITAKYLPVRGEGETRATQIVTAVCKLVYKWYNDGDVYDNTGYLTGWMNDLSSYANWLRKYADSEEIGYRAHEILDGVWKCRYDREYELLLKELADWVLDEEYLELANGEAKVGSVYNCDGPYMFVEQDEEEEEDEW